jgi:hypothetical protein
MAARLVSRRKPRKSQDEKQREKKADEQKKQLLEIKSFLLKAKVSTDFWLSDDCTDLRDFFFNFAQSNSGRFPMAPSDSPLCDAQTAASKLQQGGGANPKQWIY